ASRRARTIALCVLELRLHQSERALRRRALNAALRGENADGAPLLGLETELHRHRRNCNDEPQRRQQRDATTTGMHDVSHHWLAFPVVPLFCVWLPMMKIIGTLRIGRGGNFVLG